jgi:hypothetical protein
LIHARAFYVNVPTSLSLGIVALCLL